MTRATHIVNQITDSWFLAIFGCVANFAESLAPFAVKGFDPAQLEPRLE